MHNFALLRQFVVPIEKVEVDEKGVFLNRCGRVHDYIASFIPHWNVLALVWTYLRSRKDVFRAKFFLSLLFNDVVVVVVPSRINIDETTRVIAYVLLVLIHVVH